MEGYAGTCNVQTGRGGGGHDRLQPEWVMYSPYTLVDEWVLLAGRGARKVERLAKLPLTCELAKATGGPWQKGRIALEFLRFEVGCVEHPVNFLGTQHPVDTCKKAWTWVLDLDQTGYSSPERKERALGELGLFQSWEWFRKGPERTLLHILAGLVIAGQ